jgi:peptide-methionine (R)-S-oxide reductase
MRKYGPERAFSRAYYTEKRHGIYRCVCCGEPLFASTDTFDLGAAWPRYTRPLNDAAVSVHDDRSFCVRRTEVRSARCNAQLANVFPDGPQPTGLRYRINGQVLEFASDGA